MIPEPSQTAYCPRKLSGQLITSDNIEGVRLMHACITPQLNLCIWQKRFGFHREYSTTSQLTQVFAHLFDATSKHHSSVAVRLDVSKAFDHVWHECLIY